MADILTPTDFTIYRGTSRARLLTLTTGSPPTALNLAGCTLREVFKYNLTDSDASAAIVKTTGVDAGLVVASDPTLGLVTERFIPADTRDLKSGNPFPSGQVKLAYAVRLVTGTGEEEIVVIGTMTVIDTAARDIGP